MRLEDLSPEERAELEDSVPSGPLLPPSEPASPRWALATGGDRYLARLKDEILLTLLWIPIAVALERPFDLGIPTLVTIASVTALVYETVGIAVWGRTLGKDWQGIRVVSAKDGGRPGWRRSMIRLLVASLACLPLLGYFVYLGVLLRKNRQGWHDRAAGTLVVRG